MPSRELLGRYARGDPAFIREAVRRHPQLHAMYRFHLDTWCLGQYYPRTGDTGSLRGMRHPAMSASPSPKTRASTRPPSRFFGNFTRRRATRISSGSFTARTALPTNGLPYDLFAANPADVPGEGGEGHHGRAAPTIKLPSVNKTEWGLAILRSGEGTNARAAWLDYDSGERHGHADGMTLGLFAKDLDLLPDFGYPPVQYGGWSSPRAVWYTQTPAHNTVVVDGQNTRPGTGKTTLWFDGYQISSRARVGSQADRRPTIRTDGRLGGHFRQDSYVIDVFRVAGGRSTPGFMHGHFGRTTAQGLSLAPSGAIALRPGHAQLQAGRQASAGWSADWKIEDHLKYLPPASEVHLRHTDLTRDAEVQLAEGLGRGRPLRRDRGGVDSRACWCAGRRHKPPLSSTFVGVLEPYEGIKPRRDPPFGTARGCGGQALSRRLGWDRGSLGGRAPGSCYH